jgi:hypothetical protein
LLDFASIVKSPMKSLRKPADLAAISHGDGRAGRTV